MSLSRLVGSLLVLLLVAVPVKAQIQIDRYDYATDVPKALAAQRMLSGIDALRAANNAEAVANFTEAVRLDPSLVVARYGLGQAFMTTHRYADAVGAFEECRQAYLLTVAKMNADRLNLEVRRQFDLDILRRKLGVWSSDQLLGTRTQATWGRWMSHVENANAAYGWLPWPLETPAFLSVALGSAYFKADRLTEAEREYRAAIQSDPHSGDAHNNLAVVDMLTGRYADARREVKAAEEAGVKIDPRFKRELAEKSGN